MFFINNKIIRGKRFLEEALPSVANKSSDLLVYNFMWVDPFLLKVEQFPDRLVQWSTAERSWAKISTPLNVVLSFIVVG